MRARRGCAGVAVLIGVVAGCRAPGGPGPEELDLTRPRAVDAAVRDASGAGGGPEASAPAGMAGGGTRCLPARSSEPIPARISAMAADTGEPLGGGGSPAGGAAERPVFVADLFNLFKSHCGACHVETRLGNFQVNAQSFARDVDQKVMDVLRSDDPAKFMPPPAAGGKPFSRRAAGDPIAQLVGQLEQWVAAGRPREVFYLPPEPRPPTPDTAGYLMPREVASRMTNLGDCVPERGLVAIEKKKTDELDALFAAAKELPETLAETDLFTLDGETLARHGVLGYAPTYPLWSDDAGKLRHVRLPRGQPARFDRATQRLEIPPHTRFYKTFLKKVVDREGRPSYRKIETRLIVARPDAMKGDGTTAVRALYGTYVWNDEETEARLLRDPLRDGTPFRDRLLTYVVDEPRAQKIRESNPPNLTYALEVENVGVVRRYAIPGSERCVQCHMGSSTASFVLGFTPLQLARRPTGEGGVIEPAGPDELTQLQRLLEYGVITGMGSTGEVLPLEASQGTRRPRNGHELDAQGYMLGNCSHCHNPRGFPSMKNPELREVLDFLPSAAGGGIFQFPLDRMSPRLKRGANQDISMPYITPSLREFPVDAVGTTNWKPKWTSCKERPEFCAADKKTGVEHVDAPWRSLIYRNVDTPFAYADDYVIFPRMPLHSSGFDCRAPRLLGDWMVSIPAVRKSPMVDEDAVPAGAGAAMTKVDLAPQPFMEVKADDPGYAAAVDAARKRLDAYHAGERYNWCPDNRDIVDRAVLQRQGNILVPQDEDVYDPRTPTRGLFPADNVPERAHWVITDLTEAPGDWYPRRPDWDNVLVKRQVEDPELGPRDLQKLKDVVEMLQGVTITPELRALALTEVPFGLWQKKASCDFGPAPKVSSFTGDARPRWMDAARAEPSDPVYTLAPGAAVFGMICINCHGPQADSKGLQAEAIMMMTGGEARVANFRDGLFGPPASPGTNRARVFGPMAAREVTAEDWAGRYLAWMALGGTKRRLPESILNIVGTTRVLGEQRASNRFESKAGTANMLTTAQELCRHVLPATRSAVDLSALLRTGTFDWDASTALIARNGDADLWQRLCSVDNRPIVRVVHLYGPWKPDTTTRDLKLDPVESLYWADAYPATAPALDHRGRVVNGAGKDNLMPLCARRPGDAAQAALAEQFLAANPVGGAGGAVIPFCPPALFEPGTDGKPKWRLKSEYNQESGTPDLIDAELWSTRGAINAGLAVFLYLDQLQKAGSRPRPSHTECERLGR